MPQQPVCESYCPLHVQAVLPDRADVTMTSPFMAAYVNLLIKTCHKR